MSASLPRTDHKVMSVTHFIVRSVYSNHAIAKRIGRSLAKLRFLVWWRRNVNPLVTNPSFLVRVGRAVLGRAR